MSINLEALPLIVWLATLYVTPVALVLGIVLLLFFVRYGKRWLRNAFLVAFAIAAIGPISGVVVVAQFSWMLGSDRVHLAKRTHHLENTQSFGGILFPAGSTVVLREGSEAVESGKLSAPTEIAGLPLAGDFTLPRDDEDSSHQVEGTLASSITINGIPCAAGSAVFVSSSATNCLLSREFILQGFQLANGSFVQINRLQPASSWVATQLTIAAPSLLFDTAYPAGTTLSPEALTAEQMQHRPYPDTGLVLICLPAGAEVAFGGAMLHGPLSVSYSAESAQVDGSCPYKPGRQDVAVSAAAGFGIFGKSHFVQGAYEPKTNTWSGLYDSETPDIP